MLAMSQPSSSRAGTQPGSETINLDFTGVFKLADLKLPPPAPPAPKTPPKELVIGAGEIAAGNYFVNFARTRSKRKLDHSAITILIVEDDAVTRTLVQTLLADAGFKTRVAGNGAEFVAAINKMPLADLLILDIQLPDVSGLKILSKMRAHPRLKTLPVILFTGHAGVDELSRGVALGADGFLSKPAKAPALMAAVEIVLGG